MHSGVGSRSILAKIEIPELQESAAPLWRTRPAPQSGNLFDLAGSFYVPLPYQPALPAPDESSPQNPKRWFFRSVVPNHGPYDQKIDAGSSDESIFNQRELGN